MQKGKNNPVAKHMNRFHKPKRIEDKRYKKQLQQMEKDIQEVRKIQYEIYKKQNS
jgi:hypothetical protein